MHSLFIWFNKPFTKEFCALPVPCPLYYCSFRHCCRCNTIYSSQYDQCRQNTTSHKCFFFHFSVLFCVWVRTSVVHFALKNMNIDRRHFLYNYIKEKNWRGKKTASNNNRRIHIESVAASIFFFVSFRIWVFHLSWGSISAFLVVSSNDWNLYAIYWFICHTHDRSHRENHTQYTQLDGATNLLTFATNKTYTDFRCVAHYVLLLCIRRSEENMGEKG